MERSRVGRAWIAIREDEDAAEEAGRDDSETADADSEADDAADDIIPGAISHH